MGARFIIEPSRIERFPPILSTIVCQFLCVFLHIPGPGVPLVHHVITGIDNFSTLADRALFSFDGGSRGRVPGFLFSKQTPGFFFRWGPPPGVFPPRKISFFGGPFSGRGGPLPPVPLSVLLLSPGGVWWPPGPGDWFGRPPQQFFWGWYA